MSVERIEGREHALSGFGTKKSRSSGIPRTNGGVEHQILRLDLAPFGVVASMARWIHDLEEGLKFIPLE